MREQRILLTLDKDFGALAYQQGLLATCGVILFRIGADSPREFTALASAAIQSRVDWTGCFSVVSRHRIRMRPLPAARV
jgi:predicted nuclease of predicted toxin-antitoxin system